MAPCLSLLLVSCALSRREPPLGARPEEIPALQRAFARDSTNVGLRVRLAEAQRRARAPERAARLLEPIADTVPIAAFHLGLVREDQGRAADARRLYERYLARQSRGEVSDRVRDRLALLGRLELQKSVQDALARERELSTQRPEPRVVGVFPFLTTTNDSLLRPLGTAFAQLLAIDLAQTNRLRVVERAHLQRLLDEIRLSESRRVDPATAVRSGRLVGAGTLVQGRIDGRTPRVEFQASVVRVQTPASAGTPLRERDALARLFDVEKRLALGVYDRMGIQLTAAERDRVMQHATRNVQALLELGYGLEAQDAGRYAEAASRFARAAQLDPQFTLARERTVEAEAQARAVALPATTLSELALGLLPASVPSALAARSTLLEDRFLPVERLVPDPMVREPAVEALGAEGVSRRAPADLVIQRPAASP